MRLIWFDANSWLIEIGQQRVLVDPWLVGPLVFGNLPWFFCGKRPQPLGPLPDKIDLILLSQGLPDHAHPPTLKQFDRTIPVVASGSAAKVVEQLGYTEVSAIAPGQTIIRDRLEIRAFPGALLGPLQQENGYLLKQLDSGTTLYYEPHGFYPPDLKADVPVDVAISPIITLQLPLAIPIIRGNQAAVKLAQLLQPKVWLPTASGGNVIYEGLLGKIIQTVGTVADFRTQIAQHQLATQVIETTPGELFDLP